MGLGKFTTCGEVVFAAMIFYAPLRSFLLKCSFLFPGHVGSHQALDAV